MLQRVWVTDSGRITNDPRDASPRYPNPIGETDDALTRGAVEAEALLNGLEALGVGLRAIGLAVRP